MALVLLAVAVGLQEVGVVAPLIVALDGLATVPEWRFTTRWPT